MYITTVFVYLQSEIESTVVFEFISYVYGAAIIETLQLIEIVQGCNFC